MIRPRVEVRTITNLPGLRTIIKRLSRDEQGRAFFFIGFGGGALNGGTSALMADISEEKPDKRSANLSLLGVFYGIGALGIPVLIAALSEILSFEKIIQYTGIFIILPLVYFTFISYPPAKQSDEGITFRSGLVLIKDMDLVILGLFLFFESALEGVISNWSTTFLQDHSINSAEALYALSIYIGSLTLTRLVLSSLLRLIRPYYVLVFSIGLIFTGIFLLLMSGTWILFITCFVLLKKF